MLILWLRTESISSQDQLMSIIPLHLSITLIMPISNMMSSILKMKKISKMKKTNETYNLYTNTINIIIIHIYNII